MVKKQQQHIFTVEILILVWFTLATFAMIKLLKSLCTSVSLLVKPEYYFSCSGVQETPQEILMGWLKWVEVLASTPVTIINTD